MRRIIILLSLLSVSCTIMSQEKLNDQISFYYFLKYSNEDLKNYVVDYMNKNHKNMYNQYRNDEFDFENKKEEVLKELIENVNSFNPDKTYVINTTSKFSDYNFTNEYFEFKPLSDNTYFSYYKTDHCYDCEYHTQVRLFFTNSEQFQDLTINKDQANKLIKSRKDKRGNIDKKVKIRIYFKISDKVECKKNDRYVYASLRGIISHIEVYDNFGWDYRSGTHKLLTTIYPQDNSTSTEVNNSISRATEINKMINNPTYIDIIKLEAYVKTLDLPQDLKNKINELITNYKKK